MSETCFQLWLDFTLELRLWLCCGFMKLSKVLGLGLHVCLGESAQLAVRQTTEMRSTSIAGAAGPRCIASVPLAVKIPFGIIARFQRGTKPIQRLRAPDVRFPLAGVIHLLRTSRMKVVGSFWIRMFGIAKRRDECFSPAIPLASAHDLAQAAEDAG
jgi:hypothetical protein